MSGSRHDNADKVKEKISLIACIVIGLTFLMSGIGKIFGLESTPPQVMDFIGFIIPDIFATPATIGFLTNIFIPHIFPWIELILGFLLIIGFMPLLMAVICIPLVIAFLGTNLLSIIKGGYANCASCFGVLEKVFGSLTPVQALIYDIVLFALAVVIIVLYQNSFFSNRKWLSKLIGDIKIRVFPCNAGSQSLTCKLSQYMREMGRFVIQHKQIIPIILLGIIGVMLIAFGVLGFFSSSDANIEETQINNVSIANASVSNITDSSAVISWTTNEPAITNILIHDKSNSLTGNYNDPIAVTSHTMKIEGLLPSTLYYYKLSVDSPSRNIASAEDYFTTSAAISDQLLISKVRVTNITEFGATITWTTNKPCTSEVEYWLTGSSSRKTVSNEDLTTNHTVNLVALAQNSTYRFVVKSIDADGNKALSEREETFSLNVGIEVGKQAPDFTLNSLEGKAISLSDYRDKVVMLDFWLWSCSGCRKKMTVIQEVFAQVPPDKFAILCINVKEKESIIRNYAASEKITVPILLDPDGIVATRYRITGFPTIFFLDADGIVSMVDAEFENTPQLENILNSLGTSSASGGK